MEPTMRHLATLLLAALAAPALAQTCPTQPVWPNPDWEDKTAETATAKATEITALEQAVFTLTGKDEERKGVRTDGFVIIKDGALIYEKYGRGFGPTNKHISWSVAKSVTSTLVGVAVQQGALSLADSVCKYVPEFEGDVCNIRVLDAITFASGIDWQEEYEDASYQVSSVIAMLFGVGHRDQLGFILRAHQVAFPPGSHWSYSTGDAELAAAVAKRALMAKGFDENAFWTLLFDKLQMNATFEEDEKGTPLGGSMVYATPRDFAKVGYLMLNGGCWKGEHLLPPAWVQTATKVSDVFFHTAPEGEPIPSGYSWWLNRPTPQNGNEKPWPDVPDDAYAALGHWGQRIVVVPSLNLVVVRTGDDREQSMPVNDFMKVALEVAK